MSLSKARPVDQIAGVAAAVLLFSRSRDVRLLPRIVLEEDGSLSATLKIWSSALAIYGYEKFVARLLKRCGFDRMPSTLAAMLSLFGILRVTQQSLGKKAAERWADLLTPGVNFLGKWMGLFLAPPLASLDASIAALPRYGNDVWGRTVGALLLGWTSSHAVAAGVATQAGPRTKLKTENDGEEAEPWSPLPLTKPKKEDNEKENGKASTESTMTSDEAVRRAWIVVCAASLVGVSCRPSLPPALRKPVGSVFQLSASLLSLSLAKLLPDAAQRIFHPIVMCALTSNLASRLLGPQGPPFFDNGVGVGDRLFQWLPAAVTGLGVRMFRTTPLWLDNLQDFQVVLVTCVASGCMSIFGTMAMCMLPASPLRLPAPLSLPLLHRSVMSALGIEGSKAVGPEGDPKLAVASILIQGCIGASLGSSLLQAFPSAFNSSSPLIRGLSMGCSAHSIGTAGLLANRDFDAAAISGASMCIAGTVHTMLLQVPGVIPMIRALALPAAAP